MASTEISDREFFNGIKKYWFIWLPILALGIYWLNQSDDANADLEAKSKQINLKLESIEDQIKIEIKNGNKDKALGLTNQLVHPYHEIYSGKEENWYSDPPYYDEYWNAKREFYKNQILNN